MKKLVISGILGIMLVGSIALADDAQKRDKVDQAVSDLKKQIEAERNSGSQPAEPWNESNIENPEEGMQPNNDTSYQGQGQGQEQQQQTQTPVVNEAPQTTPTRTKKDYANMPIPNGAKLITLRTELTIPVGKDKHTIIEFPYEIKAEFGEFEARTTQAEADTLEADKQRQPVSITQKENKLVINSSLQGKAEAIIWGGPYPVVLDIVVGNSKNGVGYYVIREQDSYARSGSNVKKLESNNHEKVISILTAAMFKDKKPKGYEKKDVKKIYRYKDLDMTLVHVYSLEGDYYVGERWEVKNEDKKKTLNLYEEMFYMPNVYSVSFLANPIGPKKSTSMFIVKKREQKRKGD